MRRGESVNRRRFLALLGSAVVASIAAACGIRSDEARVVQSSVVSTTTTPTSTPAATTPTSTTTATTTTVTTATPPPPIVRAICKKAWGAQPVVGDFRQHQIDQITVHHTAVLLGDNRDAPARARQHQAYHRSLGWTDLAYHYLIDANGNVYEGRPVTAVGDTATDYDPTGHLLICCEGHFDQQELPAAQYAMLVEVLAWGVAEFAVDPTAIRGHSDLASTTCPGGALYAPISDGTLHAAVADLVRRGRGQLDVVCGSEAEARIVAIEGGTG